MFSKLYWLDEGGQGVPRKVASMNLDGTDSQIVTQSDLQMLDFITINTTSQELYWTEGTSSKVSTIYGCLIKGDTNSVQLNKWALIKGDTNSDKVCVAQYQVSEKHLLFTPVHMKQIYLQSLIFWITFNIHNILNIVYELRIEEVIVVEHLLNI